MKALFLHGLESKARSQKSEFLAKFDAECPVMDYKNPGMFNEILAKIQNNRPDVLIGSSMGGWFAYCLSTITGIPTILFNPAVHSRSMEPAVQIGSMKANHTVILGKRDNLINPEGTIEWVKKNPGNFNIHFESNGHQTPINVFKKYVLNSGYLNEMQRIKMFEEFKNID
jgi:hypothetical protein